MSVTLILEEGGKLKKLGFDLETISIGRTADNAIKVADALSSRHHCQIRREGESFIVEDMGSRNGTRLNGTPITLPKQLSPGDRIEIGDSIIHFSERRGRKSRRTTGGKRRPQLPAKADGDNSLKVIQGEAKGQVIEISALPFTIGRKPSCKLTVTDSDISGEHCMLVEDSGQVHLVDLGSTNGTFLDGVRIKGRAPLRSGQQIRLGATLTFQLNPGAAGASARRSGKQPRPASVKAKKQPPKQAVEEIESLDALDDDETAVAKAPISFSPPARDRAPSPDASDAHAVVEQEGDVTDVEFGRNLEADAQRLATSGGGAGVLGVVAALLLVFVAVGYAAWKSLLTQERGDPSATENKLENWSFETLKQKQFANWELIADQADVLTDDVRYGKRALALTVAPGTRPEFRSGQPARVEAGNLYRVRASVARDSGVSAALRLDWLRDDGSLVGSTFAAVDDSSAGVGSWRDLAGTARAPREATQVRVAGVGITGEGTGRVRFDRVSLTEATDAGAEDQELQGPAGLQLFVAPNGLLRIHRSQQLEELARDVGLVLSPGDALTAQGAARLDQPVSLQTDQSLLALGTIPGVGWPQPVEYAFAARSGAEGIQLRWQLGEGAPSSAIPVVFHVPSMKALAPLELDGQDVSGQALPKEGLVCQGVREMSWGSGKTQSSFQMSGPAHVTLRPGEGGAIDLILAIRPRRLANGLHEVGIDVQAASQRTRESIRRLLAEGTEGRKAGDFARAIKAYERLIRDFSHDEEAVARARRELKSIEAEADRLVDVLRWARVSAEKLPAPPVLEAARTVVGELEKGFPGSPQVERGRAELRRVERSVKDVERREAASRVRALLERAKKARKSGHVRLARTLYTYIVAQFEADVPGVGEAKNRLAALPPTKGG